MGDCFYQQIVAVDSSTDTVPESGASVRRVGDSVGSYLQDSARGSRRRVSDSAGSSSRRGFTDDEIHMLSCSLLSQRRGPRRAFLEATDSSTRRRLIAECKAIHARVQDSCIEYTPEVCWAINAVIENEDPKGYAILKKNYKSLPKEVKRFYDAFVENRYSVEAQEAQSLLGPYRLVQDDERVAAFLEGGATQEDALNDVVEEASVAGEKLYGDALDALDALSDQAAIMAQDFATEVSAMYTNGLGDIVAGQVSGGAEEASEEIVDNPPVEADVESEDDPAQDDDEVVEETASVEVGDSAPACVPNMKCVRTVGYSEPRRVPNRRVRVVADGVSTSSLTDEDEDDSSSLLNVSQLVFSSDIDDSLESLSDGLSVLYRGDSDSIINSMRDVFGRIFSFIDAINSVVNNGRVGEEGLYEYYDSDSSTVVGYGLGMAPDDILLSLYPTRSYAKYFSHGGPSYAFVGDGSDWKSPVMKACLAILSRLNLSNDQSVVLKNRLHQAVSDSLDALASSSTRPVVDSSAKKYAENKRSSRPVVDAASKPRVANKRVKDSCAAPSLPLPVGSSVQVSYLGNLYAGTITSVGDGSVVVSGLPIEYFNVRAENGAFTGSDADYTFASTDVVVLPADGSPVALDGPSAESEVVVEEPVAEESTPAGGYMQSLMMDDDEKIEDAIGNTSFEQELRGILRDGCVGHEDDDIFDIPLVADFSLRVDGSNPNNISAHVFEGTVDCGGLMIPTGGLSDDEKGILFVDKVTEFIKEKLGPQVFTIVDLDDVFKTSDSASVSDSAVTFDVDKIISAVQAGVDISNSDSSVGIFYDDGSDYGADSSVLFVTEDGTDIVPVSEAVGYLSSHLDAFKEAISESADAIGEALGAIGADVVSGDVHIEDAAGDEASSSVSEEIVEEQGVSETGSPEAIDWGAVGATCRQWVLDNSFKLAQEPTDANLQTACELLSAGLEVLHMEVRFDPSVPRVLCKNQRFIDVRPDGAYVGTVAFFYQTSDSAISKFASDFSDAAVQLAHKIYDIPEVSDSAPTGVDGAYVDFESKDGLLRALDAVQAGGDDFRYVRVEDDEDGKFIVAMADTFGRDKKYMSEDGETSDRAEAVRFSDKREAFERLKQLIKDGKITYSLFNTWPEEVMDDDSLLSDAAKQEVLHSIESEIKKALEEKEILVEDSVVVGIDVDRVQDGAPNTFDIPHTASTFRRIRNTKRILDSVLGVASDVLGERLTPSVYKSLCKSGSRAAKAKVSKVMDSALAMDALDLYCSDIYKRKLSDSYWVCDDVQKVADSFKLDGLSGASGSCLVSTTPFDESLSAGKQVTCFKCGSKSDIYIMLL